MGIFSVDAQAPDGSDAMQQQIAMNQAELENKRQNLYKQRLDIIKSQGGQSFVPDRNASGNSAGGNNSPLGGRQ